jgi:hypothetical protein
LDESGFRIIDMVFMIAILVPLSLMCANVLLRNETRTKTDKGFKKRLYLMMVHFAIFYELREFVVKITSVLFAYGPFQSDEPWIGFFKSQLSWILLVLALVPFCAWVFAKTTLVAKTKEVFNQWRNAYQKDAPTVLLYAFGLVGFANTGVSSVWSMVGLWHRASQYFGVSGNANMRSGQFYVSLIIIFLSLLMTTMGLLGKFAIWKRIQNSFFPYFCFTAMSFCISCVRGVLSYVMMQRGAMKPPSMFWFWWNDEILGCLLFPAMYAVLAWLFYRWEWFESAMVEKNPNLPSWMNRSTFWWWVNGMVVAGMLLYLIGPFT